MHISDGILSGSVCIGSGMAAAALTSCLLKKIKNEDIPRIAVMTAAFFVASLIHIRFGPTSGHLVLNGLVGIILGISSFPAILVALLFQSIMFQHGGITTLGVNSITMGLPALIAYLIFRSQRFIKYERILITSIFSFIAGFSSVAISSLFTSLFLASAGREFFNTAKIILLINIPIAVVEGIITLFVISFLQKVKPEIIGRQLNNGYLETNIRENDRRQNIH